MLRWLADASRRRRARRCAIDLAGQLRPGAHVRGTYVVESDADRCVVRVFVGDRVVEEASRLHGWRECLIIAVPSDSRAPYLVEDDARYRPVLR